MSAASLPPQPDRPDPPLSPLGTGCNGDPGDMAAWSPPGEDWKDDPRLTAYALGEAEPADQAHWEHWLASHSEAQLWVEELRALSQRLANELHDELREWPLSERRGPSSDHHATSSEALHAGVGQRGLDQRRRDAIERTLAQAIDPLADVPGPSVGDPSSATLPLTRFNKSASRRTRWFALGLAASLALAAGGVVWLGSIGTESQFERARDLAMSKMATSPPTGVPIPSAAVERGGVMAAMPVFESAGPPAPNRDALALRLDQNNDPRGLVGIDSEGFLSSRGRVRFRFVHSTPAPTPLPVIARDLEKAPRPALTPRMTPPQSAMANQLRGSSSLPTRTPRNQAATLAEPDNVTPGATSDPDHTHPDLSLGVAQLPSKPLEHVEGEFGGEGMADRLQPTKIQQKQDEFGRDDPEDPEDSPPWVVIDDKLEFEVTPWEPPLPLDQIEREWEPGPPWPGGSSDPAVWINALPPDPRDFEDDRAVVVGGVHPLKARVELTRSPWNDQRWVVVLSLRSHETATNLQPDATESRRRKAELSWVSIRWNPAVIRAIRPLGNPTYESDLPAIAPLDAAPQVLNTVGIPLESLGVAYKLVVELIPRRFFEPDQPLLLGTLAIQTASLSAGDPLNESPPRQRLLATVERRDNLSRSARDALDLAILGEALRDWSQGNPHRLQRVVQEEDRSNWNLVPSDPGDPLAERRRRLNALVERLKLQLHSVPDPP